MREVFPLATSGSAATWVVLAIVAFLAALLLAFVFLGYRSRGGSLEISEEGLRLDVPFYGRTLPHAAVQSDAARVVDLELEPDLALKWRTNGIGLPGYAVGWFSLRGGGKALAAVTDPKRVLYVPTEEGYVILASLKEPERALDALRRAGLSARRPTPPR